MANSINDRNINSYNKGTKINISKKEQNIDYKFSYKNMFGSIWSNENNGLSRIRNQKLQTMDLISLKIKKEKR